MLIGASPNGNFVNVPFLSFMVPGILLSTIGSVVLGIALVRAGYRPRLTSWLLAFAFPLWIVGSFVLGHNSIGLAPMLVARGASGWRLWTAEKTG
jgi:energy-converting hydrogenase Eha subunit A